MCMHECMRETATQTCGLLFVESIASIWVSLTLTPPALMATTTLVSTLLEAPGKINEFLDSCTCGRADKEAVTKIKAELESRDATIDRLEGEIRRKDAEKDNLLDMQRDLQAQILQIREALDAQVGQSEDSLRRIEAIGESEEGMRALTRMQSKTRGIAGRKRVAQIRQGKERVALRMQSRVRGNSARKRVQETKGYVHPGARGAAPVDVADDDAGGGGGGDSAAAAGLPTPPLGGEAGEPLVLPPDAGATPLATPLATPVAAYPAGDGSGLSDAGMLSGAGSLSMVDSTYGYDDGSVDSDYDYDDSAFTGLGLEILAGRLRLAKVYGQEEAPPAEDELEWEVRRRPRAWRTRRARPTHGALAVRLPLGALRSPRTVCGAGPPLHALRLGADLPL